MGGDDSQKLLPWRGLSFLSGAQQPPAFQNQHSISSLCTPPRVEMGAEEF